MGKSIEVPFFDSQCISKCIRRPISVHIQACSQEGFDEFTPQKVYESHFAAQHGSCPFVKIKFKAFSRTFKDHTKDIYGELN